MFSATRPPISPESVLICCTNGAGWMRPERYATMYLSVDLAAEHRDLVDLGPAGEDELIDADLLVGEERVRELVGRADERRPHRPVVRHEAAPQRAAQPLAGGARLGVHARVVLQRDRRLGAVVRQQRLRDAERFVARRPADHART